MSTSRSLLRQLEELYLLKCSLLPGELLVFTQEATVWDALVEAYAEDPEGSIGQTPSDLQDPQFTVKVDGSDIWFDFDLSSHHGTGGGSTLYKNSGPHISVKGRHIARDEQARWQDIVKETMEFASVRDSEYPLYELISAHLLPLLHENVDAAAEEAQASAEVDAPIFTSPSASDEPYHALLTSHHLQAPSKRRAMHAWAAELGLAGFAKLGYPGVVYCTGARGAVEDFVRRVKGMQWLALRVRFIEPLPEGCAEEGEGRWVEFEKVGEVVAEMRRLGRERYVVEIGVGSSGAK